MQSAALLCYAGSGELTFMFVTFMFVAVSAASALLLCCATVFVQCSGPLLRCAAFPPLFFCAARRLLRSATLLAAPLFFCTALRLLRSATLLATTLFFCAARRLLRSAALLCGVCCAA